MIFVVATVVEVTIFSLQSMPNAEMESHRDVAPAFFFGGSCNGVLSSFSWETPFGTVEGVVVSSVFDAAASTRSFGQMRNSLFLIGVFLFFHFFLAY